MFVARPKRPRPNLYETGKQACFVQVIAKPGMNVNKLIYRVLNSFTTSPKNKRWAHAGSSYDAVVILFMSAQLVTPVY